MKTLLTLSLAVLLSSCASDEFFAALLPPELCDHYPTVAFEENLLTTSEVEAVCDGAQACVIGGSIVVLPKPFIWGESNLSERGQPSESLFSIMRRHEFGHVNCPEWAHADEISIDGRMVL